MTACCTSPRSGRGKRVERVEDVFDAGPAGRGAGGRHRPPGQGVAVAGRRGPGGSGRRAAAAATVTAAAAGVTVGGRDSGAPRREQSAGSSATVRRGDRRRLRRVRLRPAPPPFEASLRGELVQEFGDLGLEAEPPTAAAVAGGGGRGLVAAAVERRRWRQPAADAAGPVAGDPNRSVLPSGIPWSPRPMADARSVCIGLLGRHRLPGRGRRAGRGLALPRAPALQGHRHPLGRRHRRGGRRGRAVTSTPSPPRSTRPSTSGCWPSTSRSAWTSCARSCGNPALRPVRPRRRAQGHPGRDPDARRRAGRPGGRADGSPRSSPTTPSGATCWAPPRPVAGMTADRDPRASSSTTTGRATWWSSVAGDCTHDAVAAGPRAPVRRTARRRRPDRGRLPATGSEPLQVVRRPTEQAHVVSAARSVTALRRPPLGPGRAQPRAGRRAVQPALPEDARAAWAGLLGVVGAGGLPRCRVAQPSWMGTAPEHVPEVLRHRRRRAGARWATTASPSGSWPSPRATSGPRRCWPVRTPGPA